MITLQPYAVMSVHITHIVYDLPIYCILRVLIQFAPNGWKNGNYIEYIIKFSNKNTISNQLWNYGIKLSSMLTTMYSCLLSKTTTLHLQRKSSKAKTSSNLYRLSSSLSLFLPVFIFFFPRSVHAFLVPALIPWLSTFICLCSHGTVIQVNTIQFVR